jgi:magnesium-transporting ATPase (P-type)
MGVLMITGDDPFTGANIGYECGIAFRSKGMFICDYLEDTYTSEEFIYHDRQHDRAADILAEIEEERNSNYQPLIDFDLHRRDLQDGIELV